MRRIDLNVLLDQVAKEWPGEEDVLPKVQMEELFILQRLNELGIDLPLFEKIRPSLVREYTAKLDHLGLDDSEYNRLFTYLVNRMDVEDVWEWPELRQRG